MSITKATLRAALVAATLLPAGVRAADLAADVAAQLRQSGELQGYRVSVKAKSGTVWLEGRVADEKQLAAAVGIAERSPGVERVVNRLAIDSKAPASGTGFGMPASMRALVAPAKPAGSESVRLAQAVTPDNRGRQAGAATRQSGGLQRAAYTRTAMQGTPTLALPVPNGMEAVGEGQIVPGSVRYGNGGPAGAMPGSAGGPMPMAGTGVGMPPIPMRGDGPNMPNYAWPSYAAYPNYAALQYPTQYSPTAWPYIGPFYPYPQVPLGWRRVSMEWDDGWWWIDFDERHMHSHHK
ncbi:MAG: BON domain-containing protein [Planctomycetaceae bacterium]